ncbi:MAG: alginate lyase family protein [Anaerolineales bacterium]|nr:alginate lyase family protein [Anaerolineales bacterium]
MAAIHQAVKAGEFGSATSEVWKHYQGRRSPSFFFTPTEMPTVAALVDPRLRAATLRRADDVCQDIYLFRRVPPVRFEAGVDWRCRPDGNVDWNWDLNRHLDFATLGRAYAYTRDERYALKFRGLLLDWLAHNPPRTSSSSWSSVFEVAFRINTWLWAFHLFRGAAAFDAQVCRAMLEGLLRHGQVLDSQLELHAANNHLLLEAKALAMLGLMFPEFRQAGRWRRRGLALVWREVREQVCPDGVHGERVTHYQRAIAGELLELLILLDNNGQPVPPDIAAALSRMVEFELWITKPDGLVPLFGDSGLDDTHIRFLPTAAGPAWLNRPEWKLAGLALSEADAWLLGSERVRRYNSWPAHDTCLPSRAFAQGGYYVMRQGQGMGAAYLALDAAPFGYPPVPGHGHADALNIEVYAHGQTFLADPGGYANWAPAAWRNYFRGTAAHNTVLVDGQDQSILLGTRWVYRPAQVAVHQWLATPLFDLVDASHSGYERLVPPVRHRRQVLFVKPDYWIVIDILEGAGEHIYELLFHAWPGLPVTVCPGDGVAHLGAPEGPRLWLLPVAEGPVAADVVYGETNPIQGWAAPYSGEKLPAPVVRYRHTGPAPVQFCTVLFPSPAGRPAGVKAGVLDVRPSAGEAAWPAVEVTGVQIETEAYRDTVVVDRGPSPRRKTFAGQASQARLVYLRQQLPEGGIALQQEYWLG